MTRPRYRFVGRSGGGNEYLFVRIGLRRRQEQRWCRVPVAEFWRVAP